MLQEELNLVRGHSERETTLNQLTSQHELKCKIETVSYLKLCLESLLTQILERVDLTMEASHELVRGDVLTTEGVEGTQTLTCWGELLHLKRIILILSLQRDTL